MQFFSYLIIPGEMFFEKVQKLVGVFDLVTRWGDENR